MRDDHGSMEADDIERAANLARYATTLRLPHG